MSIQYFTSNWWVTSQLCVSNSALIQITKITKWQKTEKKLTKKILIPLRGDNLRQKSCESAKLSLKKSQATAFDWAVNKQKESTLGSCHSFDYGNQHINVLFNQYKFIWKLGKSFTALCYSMQSFFGLQKLDFKRQKCRTMYSSFLHEVYWAEKIIFALEEWLFCSVL